MFLFFLLQKVDHVPIKYLYSCQLCNFLYRKQHIINNFIENKNSLEYALDRTDMTLLFFTRKSKRVKNDLKDSFLDKFQWNYKKCSCFPVKRLNCSYFFANLRLDYVLKMFLFLKKNKPLRSYKHGSYKKNNV